MGWMHTPACEDRTPVDGIAAITDRITGIRDTIATLASKPPPTATSAGSFDSILATEVANQVGVAQLGAQSAAADVAASSTAVAPSVAPSVAASVAPSVASAAAAPSVQRVGAYGPEQLANAAAIIKAGKAMGLSVRDQTIGVMTAMGESSLRVVDHGDAAGPDSRGLFQQRANGAWGSGTDRMNPTISATNFFKALTGVAGRDAMEPTRVAHAVQRNADPNHYAKYWADAVAVVTKLAAAGV
jgi:hypothetical protein